MVISILMQASKGGGLAASFGGVGGSGGLLGARGAASFLQKVTITLGVLYGVLCLLISFVSGPSTELPSSATQEKLGVEQPALPPAQNFPTPPPSEGQNNNAPQEQPNNPEQQ